MKNIEFLKRNDSEQLTNEFPDSVFVDSTYDFAHAIMGVTNDGRIVYNHFYMEALIHKSNDHDGYDYTEDFDNKDDYDDYVHIELCHIQSQSQADSDYENSPIFCTDVEFLENTFASLDEFETGIFEDEMYEEEEE